MRYSLRHFIIAAICALPIGFYFFLWLFGDSFNAQQVNIGPQFNTESNFSSGSVDLVSDNPQMSSSRLTWREHYDHEMEIQQNYYSHLLSEVSLKNNDLAIVMNDYVELVREYCGYEISRNGLKNTLQQSQMFSFLLAIKFSSNEPGFEFYGEVVRAARNTVNCSDENEWIVNTKDLL